ncbi:uncharacterized protein P174DRAFT_500994 [Aspergillus novofumigatus IBT 16806]|uniref:F-box domain-containing protein n=1 Tax=Aspergillus novofumigatus (strain IBT 16806) TaxID=1392255 RepID=A0A2I1CPI3_ASPN1|nr:uncharacterized protein P174DRAFT_500994 [Aspergillus novofumigatus IBT 16806]PKX99536.1 hypothetical protein P174DRAFT_500994 [Aspergillus novofumigatus IBT 16806]
MENLPPELWFKILSHVHFVDCVRFIHVSHKCFQYAIPRLWRVAKDFHLLEVPGHHHQIYASLIQELTVTSPEPQEHEELGKLEFTQLHRLIFEIPSSFNSPPFPDSSIQGYLVPTLTSIQLDHVANPDLLDAVASHYHQLRHIILDIPASRLTADSVIDFFKKCSSLVHIGLLSVRRHSFPPQILRYLAAQNSLRQLDIYQDFWPETIDTADLSSIPQPFRSLQQLELSSPNESAFRALIPSVRGIQELYLRRSVQVIPTINSLTINLLSSYLTELRHLRIKFYGRTRISPDDLISLGALTHLRELHLVTPLRKGFRIPKFNNTHFRALVSGLVNLREISLSCARENLTTASLIALAESCPCLVSCAIRWLEVNVCELQHCKAPLFPELRELLVNNLVAEHETEG